MSSSGIAGMFTAVVTEPPVSAATICSAAWKPARSFASARRGAKVRRDDHVRVCEQWVVGDRLRLEHVQRRAGDSSLLSSAACRSASPTSGPRASSEQRTPSLHFAKTSAFNPAGRLRLLGGAASKSQRRRKRLGVSSFSTPSSSKREALTNRGRLYHALPKPLPARRRADRYGRSRAHRASSHRARRLSTLSGPNALHRADLVRCGTLAQRSDNSNAIVCSAR